MPKKFADDPDSKSKDSGVGSLRNWLAGGIRMGSGLLSGEGMLPGAAISGIGEGLAELAEGSPLSLSRIGVEAGIGAVPLGKVFKAGHAISSGLKSGALGAVGEAGRELAKGEELNPKAIATTGALSGLTGGVLSKFLGMGGAAKAAEKADEVITTSQTGQGTGVLRPGTAGKQKGRVPDVAPRGTYDTGTPLGRQPKSSEIPYRMEDQTRGVPIRGAEGVASEPAPYRRSAVAAQKAEDQAAEKAAKTAKEAEDAREIARRREEAGLTQENHSSSSTINAPGERFTTNYSKPAEEGAEGAEKATRKTTPVGKAGTPTAEPPAPAPKVEVSGEPVKPASPVSKLRKLLGIEEPDVNRPIDAEFSVAEEGAEAPSRKLLTGAKQVGESDLPLSESEQDFVNRTLSREKKVPETAVELKPTSRGEAPPTSVEPEVPDETPLGKVLKVKKPRKPRASKKTVAGFNEGVDKIVEETPAPSPTGATLVGEPNPNNPLNDLFKSPTGITGLNYRKAQEANKLGQLSDEGLAKIRQVHMDELAKSKRGVTPNVVPTPPGPPSDDWITQGLADVDRIAATRAKDGQKGAISPGAIRALTGLTGAAIGAPIGAANSNEDEKLQGALKGAAIGGGLGIAGPSVIEAFQHPEGAVEGLAALGKRLPSIQRANLLTSKHGLPANAVAGPWGSGIMGSIEHGLSGDERGWEALKHLGPTEMLNPSNLKKNFDEAAGLIGRAEGTSLDAAATATDKVLATPGTMMTTGDLTTRNALEKGGFTPEETREITMTNEPWTKSAKNLARTAKGSPLLQFMFPFSRTTANIAEQGAKRIPLLGEFVENAMVKGGRAPDPLRTRMVQQGMGGAVGLGSGVLGANIDDPETAKITKKYLTNAAGQYSLPASIGFMAGQAMNKGKNPLGAGGRELSDALPLPTGKPIEDVVSGVQDLGDYLSGDKDFSQVRIPHSLYPGIAREYDLDEIKKLFSGGTSSIQPTQGVGRTTTKKFID